MLFTKTSSLMRAQKNLINIDVEMNEMHHQHQCWFSSLFFSPLQTLICFLISSQMLFMRKRYFVCGLIRKIGVCFLWQYVTLIYPVATVASLATVYPLLMTWDALSFLQNQVDFILFLSCERSDSLWVFILSCHYSFYDVAWNLGKIYDNEKEKGRTQDMMQGKWGNKGDDEGERERQGKVDCQEERLSEERQETSWRKKTKL